MSITFVFARDEENGIGLHNKLPWRLPADLKFFKRTTLGGTVLMGRKTYASIGKPLPGRRNVVLTRDADFAAEGVEVVHSADEIVRAYQDPEGETREELFVIGGAEIFRLLLPYADKMIVTEIAFRFEADTFFPQTEPADWRVVSREPGVRDESNPYDYAFVVYERTRA